MPNLTSSGRILRPSNGPIQVPAGRCFLVLTPNSVPGTLDLQKLTSGGSDLTALLSCRALWVNIAWCKPCKGQGTEYSILLSRQHNFLLKPSKFCLRSLYTSTDTGCFLSYKQLLTAAEVIVYRFLSDGEFATNALLVEERSTNSCWCDLFISLKCSNIEVSRLPILNEP